MNRHIWHRHMIELRNMQACPVLADFTPTRGRSSVDDTHGPCLIRCFSCRRRSKHPAPLDTLTGC